ncbi:MAG: hypothetical protein E6Q88_10865 [Lysobacteraceae bacterium]|nr:MAG: hypothetical protein E6Q88_10865 [Xanthomonadaceae bacterium]
MSFRRDHACLIADVTGWIWTPEAVLNMFVRIGAELKRTGHHRLLVLDHTHGAVPGEADMRRLISAMQGRGFDGVRVAYVDARGTAVGRMEIGEIIAREQGYHCRVFDREDPARIWLNYGNVD